MHFPDGIVGGYDATMESTPSRPTLDEVNSSGWQDILAACQQKECFAYARALEAARARAAADGQDARAAALGLLAHVCTPMVWNNDQADLGPAHVVDAISDPDLDVLTGFAPQVMDPELTARVNDVLWLRRHDRPAAERAARAYVQSARNLFDPKEWSTGFARTERALNLAASLGKKNALYIEVLTSIESDLVRLEAGDPLYFSASLMKLLLAQRAGDPAKYATRARALGDAAAADGDWWRANHLYDLAGDWCTRCKDTDGARSARIAAAEAFVSIAEARADAEPGAAAMNLQAGIEAYRRIGKTQDRVAELLNVLAEYQKRATEHFASFSTSVDLTQQVKGAMDRVRGKESILDALFALAMASRSPSVEEIRETVKRSAKAHPMRQLFPEVVVDSRTGRFLALRRHILDGHFRAHGPMAMGAWDRRSEARDEHPSNGG